jgi:hypothetical protein
MKSDHKQPVKESPTKRDREAVASMEEHFRKTGTFMAADILAVLGNPLEAVQVQRVERPYFGASSKRT